MSTPPVKKLVLTLALLAAAALTGCTNPDAPNGAGATEAATTTTGAPAPQNPGEPAAPGSPTAASQAPFGARPTPQAALGAFAALYVNWSYETLTAEQQTLAAMSVGPARLAEQQAAATSQGDTTITQGHIHNSGRVVSIAAELTQPGTWVLVTREQTGGNSHYQGLPATYHVTLAQLALVAGGYAVSQWLPQN